MKDTLSEVSLVEQLNWQRTCCFKEIIREMVAREMEPCSDGRLEQ